MGTSSRGRTVRSTATSSTPRYLGRMTRTSCPIAARTRGRVPETSARPPVLANGSTSEATNRIRRRSFFIEFARGAADMGDLCDTGDTGASDRAARTPARVTPGPAAPHVSLIIPTGWKACQFGARSDLHDRVDDGGDV